jgi:hypothetical protein
MVSVMLDFSVPVAHGHQDQTIETLQKTKQEEFAPSVATAPVAQLRAPNASQGPSIASQE